MRLTNACVEEQRKMMYEESSVEQYLLLPTSWFPLMAIENEAGDGDLTGREGEVPRRASRRCPLKRPLYSLRISSCGPARSPF